MEALRWVGMLEALLPPDIIVHNRRLLVTRWATVILMVVLTTLSVHGFELPLHDTAIYLLACAIAVYNLVLLLLTIRLEKESYAKEKIKALIQWQIILDWLALMVFVHFTGGITSPALFFTFAHMSVAVILLDQSLWRYVAMVAVVLLLLTVLEASQVLPHYRVLSFQADQFYREPVYITAEYAFFMTALVFTTYLSTSIIQPLRQRELQIASLFGTTQAVSSTLDLPVVLERLAYSVYRAQTAVGVAIHALDVSTNQLNCGAVYGWGYDNRDPIDLAARPRYYRAFGGEVITLDHDDEGFSRITTDSRIRRVYLIPIIGQRPLGVMTLYYDTLPQVTYYTQKFLKAMAQQGAIAIENAFTYGALQRAEKQRSQFARILTHELRAPVTGSQSLLRVALQGMVGDLTPRQQDIMERLSRRMDSLLVLIDDLLSLAESRVTDLEQPPEPIVLQPFVEAAVDKYLYPAQEKCLALAASIPPQPVIALASEKSISIILNNLIGNAVKYTPEHGQVQVTLATNGRHAILRVMDTGIGIPAEELGRLGEEFFRASNAKSSEIVGTGLGLASVYQLLETYHGELQVQSTPGQGSIFTVLLPLARPTA